MAVTIIPFADKVLPFACEPAAPMFHWAPIGTSRQSFLTPSPAFMAIQKAAPTTSSVPSQRTQACVRVLTRIFSSGFLHF